jgi:hypothetical protein
MLNIDVIVWRERVSKRSLGGEKENQRNLQDICVELAK